MPEDKYEFEWYYLEDDNIWTQTTKIEYNNASGVWEEVYKRIILDFVYEDSSFWLICLNNYPSYTTSVIEGMKEAVASFAQEYEIMYRIVEKKNHGRRVLPEGNADNRGYYFIALSQNTGPEKIPRSLLEMLEFAYGREEQQDFIDDTLKNTLDLFERKDASDDQKKAYMPVIETSINRCISKLRSIDGPEEETSRIKLRGLLVVTNSGFGQIVDAIKMGGDTLLPKQIKAVGRFVKVPALKSNNPEKIQDIRDRNYDKEITQEEKEKNMLDIKSNNDKDMIFRLSDELYEEILLKKEGVSRYGRKEE